jgi:hypothetical protein
MIIWLTNLLALFGLSAVPIIERAGIRWGVQALQGSSKNQRDFAERSDDSDVT